MTNRTKAKLEFYSISNLDIKMIYIENELKENKKWKENLFNRLEFFPKSRAKKYERYYGSDLEQEALIGLWNAINTFDYKVGFDFYRWAQWNISKKIRNFISSENRFNKAKRSKKKNNENAKKTNSMVEKICIKQILNEKTITDLEYEIIKNIFIFGRTLSEAGKIFDLSGERIRQIKTKAINKLVIATNIQNNCTDSSRRRVW